MALSRVTLLRASLQQQQQFSMVMPALRQKHTLPDLPYGYSALEPIISGEIMEIHHKKHHNTYVTNLNVAEEKLQEALTKKSASDVVAQQSAIKFNGGGHVNHSIFWTNLAPKKEGGGVAPSGPLADAINAQFGSLQNFITMFSAQTVAVQGSGWGWLGYNKALKRLEITALPNQDPLVTTGSPFFLSSPLTPLGRSSQSPSSLPFGVLPLWCLGLVPLLGIDVWEV